RRDEADRGAHGRRHLHVVHHGAARLPGDLRHLAPATPQAIPVYGIPGDCMTTEPPCGIGGVSQETDARSPIDPPPTGARAGGVGPSRKHGRRPSEPLYNVSRVPPTRGE